MNIYVIPVIGLFGSIFNFLCFLIFLNKEFKELVYKYLKVESLLLTIHLFLQIFRPIHFVRTNITLSCSLFAQIYQFFLLNYLASIIEMTTFILHILSTLDFYFLISNMNKNFPRISNINYKIVALVVFVFSALAFLFQPFQGGIYIQHVIFTDSGTRELYQDWIYLMAETYFFRTTFKKIYELFWFSFRDGVLLFIIIILNILIYIQVIKSLNNKKKMLKKSGNVPVLKDEMNSNENESVNKNETKKNQSKNKNKEDRAVKKLTIMVVLGCINTIVNRTPVLILFIMRNIIGWTGPVPTFNAVAGLIVYATYSLYFFLYFYSNKRFRKVFYEGWHKLF